jgi:hypothetical protein
MMYTATSVSFYFNIDQPYFDVDKVPPLTTFAELRLALAPFGRVEALNGVGVDHNGAWKVRPKRATRVALHSVTHIDDSVLLAIAAFIRIRCVAVVRFDMPLPDSPLLYLSHTHKHTHTHTHKHDATSQHVLGARR